MIVKEADTNGIIENPGCKKIKIKKGVFEMKLKKKIASIAVLCCFIVGAASPAFADSYSFHFWPPYTGSMRSTNQSNTVSSDSDPYVDPDYSTTPTNYFLSPNKRSSDTATQVIYGVYDPGYRSFTYNDGYGGEGQNYYLSGFPNDMNFGDYTITGSWGV